MAEDPQAQLQSMFPICGDGAVRLGGVSKPMVCMYRSRAGIPSSRSQRREVA